MAVPHELSQVVAAGRSLIGTAILSSDANPSDVEVSEFLLANAVALNAARSALSGDCHVSLTNDAAFIDDQCGDVDPLLKVARSFDLELRCAERQCDMPRVIARAMDLFGLANAVRCGGLVINALIGMAFESMAVDRLRPLRTRLSCTESVALANELLQVDAQREEFESIVVRDAQWERDVYTPEQRANSVTPSSVDANSLQAADEDDAAFQSMTKAFIDLPIEQRQAFHKQHDYQHIALLRLLAIEASLNACLKLRGGYPSALSALVPEFIARLPGDPFTGREFIYQEAGASFCLYSPGPTGLDSGGRFGHWFEVLAGHADLCLDIGDYNMTCCLSPHRGGRMANLIARLRGLFRWRRN
jgi:hypothetical protein